MVQTQKKRAKRCSSSSRKIEGPGCSTGLPWEKRPETTTPEMLIHKMTKNRFGHAKSLIH